MTVSSVSAFLLVTIPATVGPMPDGRVAGSPAVARMCTSNDDPNAIVVCAQRSAPSPRLPMRDARAEPGEVTHYETDGVRPDAGPPTGPPSRLGETVGKLFKGVRSLVTGEDPGY